MSTAYSIAAEGIEVLLNTEFAAEQWKVEHDNLHDSLGSAGTRIGVSPVREAPAAGNMVHLQTTLQVKFLGRYNLDINPEQRVDPRVVVGYAERFRRRIEAARLQTGPTFWFMNVTSIDYPDDPTGNKTRFVATVVASSQNSGLVETVG